MSNTENIEAVINNGGLLQFTASWCGPCKKQHPIVNDLIAEGHAIAVVDIDAHRDIAEKYDVMSVPSFLAFKDGEVVDTRIGLTDKTLLLKLLELTK